MSALARVDDISLVSLPCFADARGSLVEVTKTPVSITWIRAFSVAGLNGSERGHHAHWRCTQGMVAVAGTVTVGTSDGVGSRDFVLSRGDEMLVVPPMIWTRLSFVDEAVLLVLADRPYEADDYIHDWSKFIEARGVK